MTPKPAQSEHPLSASAETRRGTESPLAEATPSAPQPDDGAKTRESLSFRPFPERRGFRRRGTENRPGSPAGRLSSETRTGDALERQLLLVRAEDKRALYFPLRTCLWGGLVLALLAAAFGGFYGFRQLEGRRQERQQALDGKLERIEEQLGQRSDALQTALQQALERTGAQFQALETENDALTVKAAETRSHVEQTRLSVEELRLQTKRLEATYRELKQENASVLEGISRKLEDLEEKVLDTLPHTPPSPTPSFGPDAGASAGALLPGERTPQAQ